MSYYFGNLSDKQLRDLCSAVFDEQQKRILSKIDTYPVPEWLINDSAVECIKRYREKHGYSLLESRTVVHHHYSPLTSIL